MNNRVLYDVKPQKDQDGLSRREQQRLEKRLLILDAGLALFSGQGFTRTRLDEVAELAGVAKGTIYLYFKNKEALFEEVIKETLLPDIENMEQEMANFTGSARELLTRYMEHLYSVVKNDHAARIMTLMIGEGFHFPRLREFYFREVISRTQKSLVQIIERGVSSGEFRRTDVDRFTQILVSPVLISALWSEQLGEISPLDTEAFSSTHLDLLLNGLMA